MRARCLALFSLAIATAGCGAPVSQEYASPEGRYRVHFPGKPSLTEQTVPTDMGPIINKVATSKDWSGTERMVMYADFPGGLVHLGNRDRILDSACQELATEANLVILSKSPIEMNGHPGREVSFETQEGDKAGKLSGRARIYLIGARRYQVFIAGPAGGTSPETMQDFLDSFALLDQVPPPAIPGAGAANPPSVARRNAAPDSTNESAPSDIARIPADQLSLYHIPDPASATIRSELPAMAGTPAESVPEGTGGSPGKAVSALAPSSSPSASLPPPRAGGAAIRSLEWADQESDLVGGQGAAVGPDGTKDQHLRLAVELPPNAIMESLEISGGPSSRWATRSEGEESAGPIGIYQDGRPVARGHVKQVGLFSGPQTFDLYLDSRTGIGPEGVFELRLVVSIDGQPVTLGMGCTRPPGVADPLAAPTMENPKPADSDPAPTSALAAKTTDTSDTARTEEPKPNRPGPAPAGQAGANEVPTSDRPSSGGLTISSFTWVDRNEDVVSDSDTRISPGGGKDEHFRLVLDLPAATTVEEVTIVGGGVLRWTTKPSPRTWPIAVVANNELKNRARRRQLGTFSGRWTFELYVESHESVRPGQVFGVQVVALIKGIRHTVTARCQRG